MIQMQYQGPAVSPNTLVLPPPVEYQNRLLLTHQKQTRTILPNNNTVDLYNTINSNVKSNKTIVHVLDYSNGFGDYLRGSILLAQYAKYFNVHFKMNLSLHDMSKCIDAESEVLPTQEKKHLLLFTGNHNADVNSDMKLRNIIESFVKSNDNHLYITTNLYYHMHFVTEDIKQYINSCLNFKPNYYDMANELFNLTNYNVLHIRCHDLFLNYEFEYAQLFSEIDKLQLGDNTIVMSNNSTLKRKLNKQFGFHFIDKGVFHSGKIKNETELESTIIEYIILSKASSTYCLSEYQHGSGFSEQCSVLNSLPYSVVYSTPQLK